MTTATTTVAPPRKGRRTLIISAWAVPVLVIGQFAMLAIIPVGLALAATLRHAHLRALRPWTAALAAAYTLALILWAAGPDRAPSLSKDMHPVMAAVIVVAALAVIAAYHLGRTASGMPGWLSRARARYTKAGEK
jgi:hypothetical protein